MTKISIPSLQAIISLYRLFKKDKPDLVYTRGAEANFHGLIAARLAKVPVRIGEEIGISNHEKKAKMMFKLAYRSTNKVIGISSAFTSWLIESGEVSEYKAVKVYNHVVISSARCKEDIPQGRLRNRIRRATRASKKSTSFGRGISNYC